MGGLSDVRAGVVVRRRWLAGRGPWSRWRSLAACTSQTPEPTRTDTVVVAVAAPFTSLNGGTAEGRGPGSTLVRSLVQAGFVSLDQDGSTVPDEGFGTVEKVSDAPLTVRYTIDPAATWSDGTAVTTADLLLEWAARSGQLDDVTPELDAQGGIVNNDEPSTPAWRSRPRRPRSCRREQLPAVEGATLTLTYATPVADWEVALDVILPAHVVGQVALGVEDPTEAAAAVSRAIAEQDKAALSSISEDLARGLRRRRARAARRPGGLDGAVRGRPDRAGGARRAGPQRRVPGRRRRAVRARGRPQRPGPARGGRGAGRRLGRRGDAADTTDVLDALAEVTGAQVRTGGDSTLQLQLQSAGGGAFDPATYGGDAAVASAVRRAFLLTVPRDALSPTVVAPLWPEAVVAGARAADGGPGRRR